MNSFWLSDIIIFNRGAVRWLQGVSRGGEMTGTIYILIGTSFNFEFDESWNVGYSDDLEEVEERKAQITARLVETGFESSDRGVYRLPGGLPADGRDMIIELMKSLDPAFKCNDLGCSYSVEAIERLK